jgi:hypothetical protein
LCPIPPEERSTEKNNLFLAGILEENRIPLPEKFAHLRKENREAPEQREAVKEDEKQVAHKKIASDETSKKLDKVIEAVETLAPAIIPEQQTVQLPKQIEPSEGEHRLVYAQDIELMINAAEEQHDKSEAISIVDTTAEALQLDSVRSNVAQQLGVKVPKDVKRRIMSKETVSQPLEVLETGLVPAAEHIEVSNELFLPEVAEAEYFNPLFTEHISARDEPRIAETLVTADQFVQAVSEIKHAAETEDSLTRQEITIQALGTIWPVEKSQALQKHLEIIDDPETDEIAQTIALLTAMLDRQEQITDQPEHAYEKQQIELAIVAAYQELSQMIDELLPAESEIQKVLRRMYREAEAEIMSVAELPKHFDTGMHERIFSAVIHSNPLAIAAAFHNWLGTISLLDIYHEYDLIS